jgi:hypothetical protein
MKTARTIKRGLDLYRELPSNEKAWVRQWLQGDATPIPVRHAKALFSAVTPMRRTPTVFLSHSHADKAFVRSLAKKLGEHGIDYWLDEAEIRTGESLIQRLSDAVADVDYVLAVLSPASVRSRWVREELQQAMTRQIKGRRFRVLPVVKATCKLPAYLEGRLYRDFSSPYRRRQNTPVLIRDIVESFDGR